MQITVKTQEELDNIPDDYNGKIYIENNNIRIIVKNRLNVVAWENSSVVAYGNSSVVAWENSSVVAYGNSSVVARANAQVLDRLYNGKINISGNARIVYMPKNIYDFMDYYNIKHTKTKAKFFKAVHKKDGKYVSNYDSNFIYQIGESVKAYCDTNIDECCSYGINICHLNWALDYAKNWKDISILEVETKIEDIIMPTDTDGKVRTPKVKVIREVPLEECGVLGKIIAREKTRSKR